MVRREIMDVWSSNLRLLAHGTTDEELERAIRSGITPQSTSDWLMPSMDYSYMSEDDATAPSPARPLTESALRSETTSVWPPRMRRRVIFAPIFPKPTIPSCINTPKLPGLETDR